MAYSDSIYASLKLSLQQLEPFQCIDRSNIFVMNKCIFEPFDLKILQKLLHIGNHLSALNIICTFYSDVGTR